ncbi:MAG TPA: FAD-dependent oxidoreductase [Candidatus Angelobacter sp.]|nr:FAD-dependent oxidoreductase [Candidatus Angelobacter sp.]
MIKDDGRNGFGRFDVVVVGAGPAGIAASVRAAESGARVALVDDNPSPGGQIWRKESRLDETRRSESPRGESKGRANSEARSWFERLQASKVLVMSQTRIFDQPRSGALSAECGKQAFELEYSRLVLATGARELFLPFPGWTLPGVMGAGGLQAQVKSGLPVRGKKVIVAGTGPLLLAVAAFLKEHGAEVPMILEQTTWSRMFRFAAVLLPHPEKLLQAFQLRRQLSGVRMVTNGWVIEVHGQAHGEGHRDAKLQAVTFSAGGSEGNQAKNNETRKETLPCDYLACSYHLVPNIELAALLGCRIKQGFVEVDDFQRTSIESVFCAGEPTGIGGVELALVEGEIAGLAAAEQITLNQIALDQTKDVRGLLRRSARLRRLSGAMDWAFQLQPGLRHLPQPETIICRCEDVTWSQLNRHQGWRSAKLQTRCGMGPCQGRICGAAVRFLLDWEPQSVRPPVFPVRLGALAGGGHGAT